MCLVKILYNNENKIYPDELADLPRYASCGLIRFKMSMFRETTYRY